MIDSPATGDSRRWLVNAVSTLAGEFGSRGLQLAAFLVLARELGPEGIAQVSLAFVLVGFGMIATNIGLDVVGMRDVAERPGALRRIALRISLFQLCLAALVAVVLVGAGFALESRLPGFERTMPAILLYLVPYAFNVGWALAAVERLTAVAVARTFARAFFLVAAITLVSSPTHAALAWAVSGAIETAFIWVVVIRRTSERVVSSDGAHGLISHLRRGLPFLGAQLTHSVYFGLDQIVLAAVASAAVLGEYAAVFNACWPATGLVGAIYGPTYPGLVRRYQSCGRCFWQEALPLGRLLALLGATFAAVYFAIGPWLLPRVLGGSYTIDEELLAFLTLAAGLYFSRAFLSTVLIVPHLDRYYFVISLGVMLTNAVGVVALAPAYGAPGAALALVLAELVGLGLALYAWRHELRTVAVTFTPWLMLAPFAALSLLGPLGGLAIALIALPLLLLLTRELLRARTHVLPSVSPT